MTNEDGERVDFLIIFLINYGLRHKDVWESGGIVAQFLNGFLWGGTKSTRYCGHFWPIVQSPDDR
jgi:hypothetical protein